MNDIIEKLCESLIENDTDQNRKKWANYIIRENISVLHLSKILSRETKLATRFIWLVGDLCEFNPKVVSPAITHFYKLKNAVSIKNYNRSLAKMFWLCGVPSEIEGAATSDLFKWVSDPNEIVTTKIYSINALFGLSQEYPDLKNEMNLVIIEQLEKVNSASFSRCAENILKKLSHKN